MSDTINSKFTYYGFHIPSGENWVILAISKDFKKVCVAGWPPSIAELSDIKDLKIRSERTENERNYVLKTFGLNWML